MVTSNRKERNDALDALAYSMQSIDTTGSVPGTNTSSSTTGMWDYLGSSSSPEPMLSTRPGETIPYEGNAEDMYKEDMYRQNILGRQQQDLISCIYILSRVLQRLTEQRVGLDSSDLRTLEPFEYRVRMNHLDELFMFVTQLMDSMTADSRPDWLREKLAERGIKAWQL